MNRPNEGGGADPDARLEERWITLEGRIQGVGFRPFVARLAAVWGVRGWVRNDVHGVGVRALGSSSRLAAFIEALGREAPPAARIERMRVDPVPDRPGVPPLPDDGFVILPSEHGGEPPTAPTTPDLALCDECRRELLNPAERRAGYPFLNCTQCGPRYTIVESLPYDRPRTTMAEFEMCPSCRREYEDSGDRRYHAQPIACPECGPQVELQDPDGRVVARRDAGIAAAAAALRDGRVVAVKGLGGYHLVVDATSAAAVGELRRRKHREEKPLAVMFPAAGDLREWVEEDGEAWLHSAAAPIVLLRRRAGGSLAEAVAPGNPWIGAFLPYSPLHLLLLRAVGRPLVVTSGNLSEEPLCFEDGDARQRLGRIADQFLVHDRRIARPIDDSVLRPSAVGPILLRRARGYAPAPFPLPADAAAGPALLAVGGHLKNTVAVTVGAGLVLCPHVGDLGNPASLAAFRASIAWLRNLYPQRLDLVACDAHPDYASTQEARLLGLPTVPVQHHLAHVLSCLLEHGGGPSGVLGVAWDGTGYGGDGTVWGGEFISIDRGARVARRVAHLRPFRLPGGEAAVREPRRCGLALAHAVWEGDRVRLGPLARTLGFSEAETSVLLQLLDRGHHAPVTTSAGRLFDGVAALLGLGGRASFEGQVAMALEGAAAVVRGPLEPWPMPVVERADGRWEIDWRPLVEAVIEAPASADRAVLAARFHRSLATALGEVARRVGWGTVALSGGCFQNARLLEHAVQGVAAAGFSVLCHRELPPNDGGLAAGQALAVRWGITRVDAAD
ncbi:MAG: carbamoyltransferase HypF [Verrucomicrobia bacterium]|nr:carbamoyltransferase HypF [Verrucomicrobiota bacterium]